MGLQTEPAGSRQLPWAAHGAGAEPAVYSYRGRPIGLALCQLSTAAVGGQWGWGCASCPQLYRGRPAGAAPADPTGDTPRPDRSREMMGDTWERWGDVGDGGRRWETLGYCGRGRCTVPAFPSDRHRSGLSSHGQVMSREMRTAF